ncbi:succinate dehydrogenase, hydrophobic membrane anchor protein [Agitococcus lubricus]|uniref:Succinate dehydrogenase hydrophobic membrane anchor subunit n=1 Tax=Agitococcus lubricus TaxID=1077255 RepID=A0A2T5ISZ8_9GAMM|nr:succinate dehydrogenase, hydrophobic membrane anchor protein [Agitococcus lubricus]PTQ86953.1 succinate dehydrogenase subunit D [Agitococcus lubricus]
MKSATSFSRSGTSDWLIQRVSAVILAVYFVVVLGWLLLAGEVTYSAWHDFMTCTIMRIFSLSALLSLAGHSWVGLWTVTTDYMTTRQMGASANFLRLIAQIGMAIVIFVYVVWGIMILWGN